MPNTNVRVVGSGFTTFTYAGRVLAWCQSVTDSGQEPLTQPMRIIPLGARHPVEIVTGRVVDAGNLTLSIHETWNEPVWWQLGLTGANTIVDVYERLAQQPNFVSCQLIIRPPNSNVVRGKVYHNCVVTRIDDSESVQVGALAIPKTIVVHYTHTTSVSGTA